MAFNYVDFSRYENFGGIREYPSMSHRVSRWLGIPVMVYPGCFVGRSPLGVVIHYADYRVLVRNLDELSGVRRDLDGKGY